MFYYFLLQCEGYYDVIKRPMSLDVIRKKVEQDTDQVYKDLREFVDDVRLIFHNACVFNAVSKVCLLMIYIYDNT